MADKSDDIKQLFSHLGLNPNDYHEIRSAPTANAKVSESPRRWSLLQAAAPQRHAQPVMPPALPTALMPTPVYVPAPAPAPVSAQHAPVQLAPMGQSLLPAALLAAAEDILRAEANGAAVMRRSALAEQAPTREPAMPEPVADLGLQSLFQSVKEPQTAAHMPPLRMEPVRAPERRSEVILETPPAPAFVEPVPMARGMSFAERAAALAQAPVSAPITLADEPETRYAAPPPPPPPSRLGPVPTPVAAPIAAVAAPNPMTAPSAPAVPAPASGRLRFASSARETSASHGESLQDVFRRLSRDNRA